MKAKIRSIALSAGSLYRSDTSHLGVGRLLYECLAEVDPSLSPSRVGDREPLVAPVPPDSIEASVIRLWGNAKWVLWDSAKSKTHGIWHFGSDSPIRHSSVFFYGDCSPAVANLIALVLAKLSSSLSTDLGYVHARSDEEWEKYKDSYNRVLAPFNTGFTTASLRNGIPNLAWSTYFGDRYINMIGRDRLLSCPSHSATVLSSGLIGIQLTPSVEDIYSGFRAFDAVRSAAIKHLGTEFFCNDAGVPKK